MSLTPEQETAIGELLTKKKELLDLAKTVDLSTLPLQLVKLRKEREAIIEARDVEVDAIKAKSVTDINAKMAEVEPTIDSKEAEIAAVETQLTAVKS